MEKEFVPRKLAYKLQLLGFNEPCIAWYYGEDLWMVDQKESEPINYKQNPIRGGNGILAPTFSQAFRWFREKCKDIKFKIQPSDVRDGLYNFFDYEISIFENKIRVKSFSAGGYESNEEAELATLNKLIEICKNK